MFDKIFKICLLVLGGGLLFTLFESTQNGRYLYSQENDTALIVDTRTGFTDKYKTKINKGSFRYNPTDPYQEKEE